MCTSCLIHSKKTATIIKTEILNQQQNLILLSFIPRLAAATPVTMARRTKGKKALAVYLIKVGCEMTAFRNEDSETQGKLSYYAKSDGGDGNGET